MESKNIPTIADALINAVNATHPVQLGVLFGALFIDVIGLFLINQYKRNKLQKNKKKKDGAVGTTSSLDNEWSWESRRNCYLVLLFVHIIGNSVLDAYYEIDTSVAIHVKNYATAFWIGLLDYYYSNTYHVSYHVFMGAAFWCFCSLILPRIVADTISVQFNLYDGEDGTIPPPMDISQELSLQELAIHSARFMGGMVGVGMLADLIFSPMHRLMHAHTKIYQLNHKVHHQYTNNITSLVLYHGTALDDFLMPLTVTIGFTFWWLLTRQYYNPFSNVYCYLTVPATIFSHSHDVRCARLMMPGIPDSLNFVAYHHSHHLHPNKNYGLTKPSDLFWDWILGVDTILTTTTN